MQHHPKLAHKLDRLLQSAAAQRTLLLLAAALFLCRFLHLAADYPATVVRWDDGILTDEGWYAAAAIHQHAWGLPLLSGDMNTAVLLPVWPLLAHIAFSVFGYHVEVLRGLAVVASLVMACMCCILLRRYRASRYIPLFLAFLAANPWAFVISRAAFLEGPMLVFFLAALLLARQGAQQHRRLPSVIAGLLFGTAFLTKSSVLPLAPVLAFTVLQRNGYRWKPALRSLALIAAAAALVVLSFYRTVTRHFSTDALFYLSTVPAHTQANAHALLAQCTRPFRYAPGSDHLLFLPAVLLLVLSAFLLRLRTWWRDPLFALSGVWIATVLLALCVLNNVMVHYLALLIPALLLLAVAVLRLAPWPLKTACVLLLSCDLTLHTVQVAWITTHPRYTVRDAARGIDAALRADPAANHIVLGDNATEMALQTGIQPLNLFAHSAYISRQANRFHPDWWLAYAPEDDGTCYRVLLSHAYQAQQRGEWTLPQGRTLTLYRLQSIPGATLPSQLTSSEQRACRSPFVARQREFPDVPVDPRFAR